MLVVVNPKLNRWIMKKIFKNAQVKITLFNKYYTSDRIYYYPMKDDGTVYIGCQTFNTLEVLSYLAKKLGYNLNFKTTHHNVERIASLHKRSADILLKENGKELFKILCFFKRVDIC